MLSYLSGKWKVLGGPFCGVGVLLKKVPGSHGMRVAFWSHPISSYSTDLASVAHTMIAGHSRPRYGSRAAAAFAEKGLDPSNQQQLVWQRETDRVGGQTMWIKGKPRKGLEEDYDLWKRTMVSTIIFIYRTGGRSLGREIVFTTITEPWL